MADIVEERRDWAEVVDKLRAEIEQLRAALREITGIENKEWGPDWEEIEQARDIARAALEGKP